MGIGNGEVAAIPSACVRERCAVLANYFEFRFGWLRVGGGIYHRYRLGLMHFWDFLGGYFKRSGNYELLGFWLAQWAAPGPA